MLRARVAIANWLDQNGHDYETGDSPTLANTLWKTIGNHYDFYIPKLSAFIRYDEKISEEAKKVDEHLYSINVHVIRISPKEKDNITEILKINFATITSPYFNGVISPTNEDPERKILTCEEMHPKSISNPVLFESIDPQIGGTTREESKRVEISPDIPLEEFVRKYGIGPITYGDFLLALPVGKNFVERDGDIYFENSNAMENDVVNKISKTVLEFLAPLLERAKERSHEKVVRSIQRKFSSPRGCRSIIKTLFGRVSKEMLKRENAFSFLEAVNQGTIDVKQYAFSSKGRIIVSKENLYSLYLDWCKDKEEEVIAPNWFGRHIKTILDESRTSRYGWVWIIPEDNLSFYADDLESVTSE